MPARKKVRRSAKKSPRRKSAPKRKSAARKPARKAVKPARKQSRPAAAKPAAPKMPPSPPNAIGFVNQHMDYTTHDVEAVRRFYVDQLGFTDMNYDPSFSYLWVHTGHSSSLGFMPPMPGMGEPSPLKEPTIYIMVADVDRTYADLSRKGVHFEGPPADMPWGHRVISTLDPEGRRIMFATRKMPNA